MIWGGAPCPWNSGATQKPCIASALGETEESSQSKEAASSMKRCDEMAGSLGKNQEEREDDQGTLRAL